MKARRGGQGASRPRSPRYRIFHKTLGLEQGARELIVAAHSVGFARPRKRQHRVAPRKPSNSLALVHPLHAYTRLPPRVCARSASLCVRVFTRVQLPPSSSEAACTAAFIRIYPGACWPRTPSAA